MTPEPQADQTTLEYTAAHEAHYKAKNLQQALGLYEAIIATHPDAQEAAYARMQIHNIASSVIPRDELLEVYLDMSRAHLESQGPVAIVPAEGHSLPSERGN